MRNELAGRATMPASGSLWRDILHLSILILLAIVQPLFSVLSQSPEFFIVRGNRSIDVVMLVILLCIGLPAAFALLEIVCRLISQTLQKAVHIFFMFALLMILITYGFHQLRLLSGYVIIVFSFLIALLLLLIYFRTPAVRIFFTFLAPAFVLIPLLFLTNQKISQLLRTPAASKTLPAVHSNIPVVLIVFDEFALGSLLDENGSLDAVAFPNFAAFAQQSTWYRNVTAVSDHTEDVVPAILSGIYPREKLSPTAWNHPDNLFALLQASYDLKVTESLTRILSKPRKTVDSFAERMWSLLEDGAAIYLQAVLPPELAQKFPAINQTWQDFWKGGSEIQTKKKYDGRGGMFEEFIASISPSKRTPLYFLHTVLPHGPWEYFPSGVRYNFGRWTTPLAAEDTLQDWNGNQLSATRAYQRYLLQVGYVDRLVGKTMDRFKAIGIYDQALIIMIADHGISFVGDQKRREVTSTNIEDVLMVPLFIKYPYQHEVKTDDQPAESIDITPTIADVLKLQLPWKHDGVSLLSENGRKKKIAFEWFGGNGRVLRIDQPQIQNSANWKKKIQLFGKGGIEKVFHYRTAPDLVGHPLKEFQVQDGSEAKIELQNEEWYRSVNIESGFLPAQVTAKLRNESSEKSLPVAISINGTICAVAEQFKNGNDQAIVSITPESCFRPGFNDLQFFFINNDPAISLQKIGKLEQN
jgi:hypothetical protein